MSTPIDQPPPIIAYPVGDQLSPDVSAPVPGSDPADVAAVNPDDPPWGLPAAVGVLFASLALLVLIPVFTIIPYVIWRGVNLQAVGEMLQTDKTAILISILANFPAHLLTLALVWAIVTGFGKRPFWGALGWSWSPRVGFWASAGIALGLFGLGLLIFQIFGDQETALTRILNSSTAARYAVVLMAILTAPLVEEVVYRGVLYPALQRRVGRLWGVLGVMMVFAIIHVPQYLPSFGAISTIGVLSLSLTLVRAYTGQLLPCVVIHAVFNSLSSVGILLEPFLKNVPSVTDQTTSTASLILARLAHLSF